MLRAFRCVHMCVYVSHPWCLFDDSVHCKGLGGIFTLCLYMHVEEDPVPFVVNWLVDYSYSVLCSCQ